MTEFPLPGAATPVVVAPAPGRGPQFWTGAPSAVLDGETIVLGYRVRNGPGTTDETVIAVSDDGETYETVLVLPQEHFGAQWTERPALARTEAGWRLWVSCATPNSKHWYVAVLEAPTLEALADAEISVAFAGDEDTAVKDPIIRRTSRRQPGMRGRGTDQGVSLDPFRTSDGWAAWLCCHLLDVPGAEDRMNTAYATSADGWTWDWHGTVLEGVPGTWSARGARLTTVLPDGRAAYDARASEAENWFERTGVTRWDGERFAAAGEPLADVRYLEVLPLPGGGFRIWYEARLPDESHELRTELIAE